MLRIGTSAFTAAGWEKSFYPPEVRPPDYLHYYATQFDTVEVDSTFYRIPSLTTVRKWRDQTPDDFIFAAKVPQVITHEKCLQGCEDEMRAFLEAMDGLGPKLGPLLLQFPYFNKKTFATADPFLERLEKFLKKLPKERRVPKADLFADSGKAPYRFAVEVRNKAWVGEGLLELLRDHGVALALIDHPWMAMKGKEEHGGSTALWESLDPITADFTYIRLLGDRHGIEERTKTWDKVIVDRKREVADWVKLSRKFTRGGIELYAYVNNHFAGHGPAIVRMWLEMWKAKVAAAAK